MEFKKIAKEKLEFHEKVVKVIQDKDSLEKYAQSLQDALGSINKKVLKVGMIVRVERMQEWRIVKILIDKERPLLLESVNHTGVGSFFYHEVLDIVEK